ncbi:hypothetical protein T4D_10946 [Trichinella pseudospiralis]|uniref:Uncharacterized protein n=1 Tax=Trichinella pseudospiralis TaxID=6337 RepID=A0A0V1FVT6_TRIPS|nr:hypothetical protein T4D_10946 [Trichinella pseudospiralis]
MLHKQKTNFIDLKTSTLQSMLNLANGENYSYKAVVGLRCAVAEQCDFLVEIWMSIYEKLAHLVI